MKLKLIILSFLALFFSTANAQTVTTGTNASPEVETVADELPEYPGGVMEMMRFLKANIKYPQRALDANISGKCQLKFTVNPDGSISEVVILEGVKGCAECDAEAIRVVNSMPKWKPGRLAGKNVALYYNLPVNFALPKK